MTYRLWRQNCISETWVRTHGGLLSGVFLQKKIVSNNFTVKKNKTKKQMSHSTEICKPQVETGAQKNTVYYCMYENRHVQLCALNITLAIYVRQTLHWHLGLATNKKEWCWIKSNINMKHKSQKQSHHATNHWKHIHFSD